MAEKLSTGFVDALNVTGSVKGVMTDFIIHVFDGTQPANADTTEGSANILLKITKNAGAFTSGVSTNGLNFGTSSGGVLSKNADNWQGYGLAAAGTGTVATWFRAYANTVVTGDSTTAVRFDGAVGTSSVAELRMSNNVVSDGGLTTISTFTFTIPKA